MIRSILGFELEDRDDMIELARRCVVTAVAVVVHVDVLSPEVIKECPFERVADATPLCPSMACQNDLSRISSSNTTRHEQHQQ